MKLKVVELDMNDALSEETKEECHILKLTAVYLYDFEEVTYLVSFSSAYWLHFLYCNYTLEEDYASDELRDKIDEMLTSEFFENIYRGVRDIDEIPEQIDLEEDFDENIEDAIEYCRGNHFI